MKDRVKTDTSLLSLLIIFTGFLYMNRHLYAVDRFWDNVLDFIGMIAVIKGVLLRMSARGYKKVHSHQGGQLVEGGPYVLVRNPMYLGSFLIGAGFVLIVWPWWSLPIFALLFYVRFNRQIVAEEKHLAEVFPQEFAAYSRKTPRVFPSFQSVRGLKPKKIFDVQQAFSTNEIRGLWAWPLLAVGLELMQESLVLGSTDLGAVLKVFVAAVIVFVMGFWIVYHYG